MWLRAGGADGPAELLHMVSFAMEPQWCGHLFAVCGRHEKAVVGALPGAVDAFAVSATGAPALDVGWIAVAGTFGLQVCRLSWTLDSVKATGVIFLLGVGSLMFYKLYHLCCTRRRPRRPSYPHSPSQHVTASYFPFTLPIAQLDDSEALKGLYFGPQSPTCDEDLCFRWMQCTSVQDGYSSPSSSSCGRTSCEDEEGQDADVSEGSGVGEHAKVLAREALTIQGAGDSWSPPVRQRTQPLRKAHARPLGHALNPCCPRGWRRPRHFSIPVSHVAGCAVRGMRSEDPSEPQGLRHSKPGQGVWCQGGEEHLGGRRAVEAPLMQISKQAPVGIEAHRQYGTAWEQQADSMSSDGVLSHPKVFWDEEAATTEHTNDERVRDIPRDSSFDSTCSDLSLDFSLRESADTSTMACMDMLQKEIDQLKTNCLIMDEEFETIKCNRNFPGMSSLMKGNIVSEAKGSSVAIVKYSSGETDSVKQQKARACFAGLYSLTTIKNSTSSEMSDSFPGPGGRNSMGSAESLEWDSPLARSPLQGIQESMPLEFPDRERFSSQLMVSEDDLAMVSLEWDTEDLVVYPEEATAMLAVGEPLYQLPVAAMDVELSFGQELGGEVVVADPLEASPLEAGKTAPRSPLGDAPASRLHTQVEEMCASDCQMVDSLMSASFLSSQITSLTNSKVSTLEVLPLHWSSEESGYMDWDGRGEENRHCHPLLSPMDLQYSDRSWGGSCAPGSSDVSELSTPGTEHSHVFSCSDEQRVKIIGERVKVYEYALHEWQGQTRKAETILKGYAEIPSILGMGYIRQIRGDNYCAVRATIFLILSQSIAVPSGQETYKKLSSAYGGNCHWLQEWEFPEELPYCKNNVLLGMKKCLEKLDRVASFLAVSDDKETTLASLLNSDASLDLHIVESVKLLMLLCAIELHGQSESGAEVPLFAILMFARNSSETPQDFMSNHLRHVGHSGGLEQVEMFLLGHSLGVTLQVVRPSMFGTNEFICCYPDRNVGTWPQVSLIAEDDRHYNVLVR